MSAAGTRFLGITWRRSFLALASFVFVSILIWPVLWHVDKSHLERLGAEWSGLFELCRSSVELDVPLLAAGLGSAVAGRSTIKMATSDGSYMLSIGGRFAAHETTFGDGKHFRRSCSVVMADERSLLDRDELATLLLVFLELREQLFETGEYVFSEPDPIPPMTLLAFSMREGNVAGCSTIAYISANMSTRHFASVVGEQAINVCSAR